MELQQRMHHFFLLSSIVKQPREELRQMGALNLPLIFPTITTLDVARSRHAWHSAHRTSDAVVSAEGVVHLFPNVEVEAVCGDEEPDEYAVWQERNCTIEVCPVPVWSKSIRISGSDCVWPL